jgi:tetratricopeptide (TPR) repeat protein
MRHLRQLAVLAAVLLLPLTALAADEILMQAKKLVDAGDGQSAYNLLIPLQSERAGDPDYDFLLGSAALQIGKNTEAVFAMERVLALKPDSAPARALIARAYFNLKETETSKREFESVRKQDLPEEVASSVDRYLDAIARLQDAQRFTARVYVETSLGYDTNINGATADSQVAVPAFGGLIFNLGPSGQKTGDSFYAFGAGVNVQAPITKVFSIFGGASFATRTYFNEFGFDTNSVDANLGIAYRSQRDAFTLGAQYGQFFVENPALYQHAYRNATGGTAQWQHDFDSRNQASVFVQGARLTYPDQEARDADRYVGGLGYAHAFGRGTLIAYLGGYGGEEKEVDSNFPYLGHDLYGARVGAQWNVSERYAFFVNGSGEHREYHGEDPSFLVTRKDNQMNASVGILFFPKKGIQVSPQVSWTKNNSNISIDAYDRIVGQVSVRGEF